MKTRPAQHSNNRNTDNKMAGVGSGSLLFLKRNMPLADSHYKAARAVLYLNKKTEKQFPPYLHSKFPFVFCTVLGKKGETRDK